MARQVRTVMFLFLLLLATGFGPVAMAAMDPVQVLLVDDAHALFDGQSDTNVSDYVDRYRNALQQMENVEVDVTRTGDAAPGPAAKEMDQYDLVIWYTLGDYSGLTNKDECDNANDCVVFHPKGGSGDNTVGASGDVGNISQYLLQQNGRILITGHNVITNPPGSGFLNDVLGAAQYSKIYRNEDTSTNLGLGQVGHELVGELNDPVTRGTGFTLQLDTNIEPEDQRNFFLDACDEDDIGDDKYCDTVDSDDAFRWRDTNNNNFYTLESGHSNDDDSDADDYAHSLVRTNRTSRFDSQYKSILMGVGFEALTPESKRHKLMNYTFHYLLGPRSRDTTVQDLEKGIIGEAGTFTQPSLSSSFQTVSFQHTYTKPVIVGTTNTLAGASTPHNLILEAQNVGGGSAQLRLCDSAGSGNTGACTGPSIDQKGGYLVVDRAHTDEIEGIEAGTFNTSGDFDDQGERSITFDEEFESAPLVFATIQTTPSQSPVAAKAHSITKNGFKGGICFQNSENDCANNVAETKVGWIAIEPSKIPFLTGFSADRFTDTVDGSTRYHSHAFGAFTSSPVMLAEQQTYNGQEDLVSAGIGSINTTGYNIMLCELNRDSCNGHKTEQVATLALPSGTIYSNLADYKGFTNDEIRLRSTGINKQISGGTKIGSARFYHNNSTHGMQSSYFLDDGFEHDLGNNWTVQQYNNGGSASTSDGCGASKGTEALRIKNGKVNVTTKGNGFNLSGEEEVTFSYDISRGGSSDSSCDDPEGSNEDLYVQYRAAGGEWKTIKRHDAETGELPVRSFRRFEFTLPVNKLPNGNLEIRFNYRHDTSWKDYWVIDDFEIEDGRRLQPLDGRFGEESSETVNLTGVDATDVTADLSSYPEGINVTYGIQFRDTTAQRYWGPMGTDWLVVDTVNPDPPDSFGFTSNYTQHPVVDMSFDFKIFPRYRPGLFRFSCSSNGPWSQWKVYDLDKSLYQKGPFRSEIPVNLTNTNAGCVTEDGNKTIYVQGRDFANNSVTVAGSRWTGSDWIVLDRYVPNMTDHAPDNMSHINGTQNITVNATDFRPPGVGTVSGVSREKEQQFFNGSSEGLFTANKSFDPGYNTNILQGLVGFWRMDRTSGKALDYSGNQNHGTVSGATRGVQGILGTQAFRFDGSNERVEVPDSPALNVNDTDRLTISLWVRSLSSDSGFRDMLDKSNSYLFYLNNRKPTLVLYTAGDWVSITASKRVNTGAWHHLVAQYNGTHLRLFINGKLNKQKQVSITGIQGSATQVLLGNYPSLGYPCKCRLDEARIYDRALPRSQIRNLYSGPHPLLVTLFDRAANSRQRYLQYFLDFNQPRLTSAQPRTRVVPQGGQIGLTLFDLASNVSHVGLYNETAWVMNSTRQQVRTTVTLTEPWTTEGDHNLTIWANDSVGHVFREKIQFNLDASPPRIASLSIPNGSAVRKEEYLNATFTDQQDAGIFAIWGSILGTGMNSSLIRDQNYIRKKFFKDLSQGSWYRFRGWSNDTLGHLNSTTKWYLVDDSKPNIVSVTAKDGFVNSSGSFDVRVRDSISNVSRIAVHDGQQWWNRTVRNETWTRSIDPQWDTEKYFSISVIVNDSANNIRFKRNEWQFALDTTPPIFKSVTQPGTSRLIENNSFIRPTANLSINVEDPVLQTSEDPGSGVHLGVLRNGTTNITFKDDVEFDPGLTTSITHNLSVWFNDSVSNTNRTLYQFKVDGLPPVLTSASPSNDTFITNTTSILLEFDDRGARGGIGRGTTLITVYNGSKNLTVHEGDTFDPGWTSEGEHRLIIWKNDSLGNTNATRLNYTVDNTPPQTTDNHTQNINNNGWNGWHTTNRSVKITATDNFNPVAIQACIYDTAIASSCSPSHQGSPNITLEAGCPDGEACILKLQYRTNDSAGNLEQKQTSINISIDRADPAVEFQRPTSGSTVGGVVEFDTHLSDVGAGINDANYSIVNTTGTTTSIVRSGDLNASTGWSWNTSWDSRVDLSGTFDFNVSIKDRSGRIKTKNISITVDNGKPAVSIASPTGNYYRKDIPINIEAERPGAGNLKNHSYRIYNTTTGNVINWSNATGLTSSSHTFDLTVDIASLPDGNYTINSTAWDDSSQKGWASNTFVLDTAAPNLSVSAPANNTWQTGTTSITNIVEEQHKDRCVLQYRDEPGAAWQGNRTATCSGSDTFDTENCNDDSTTDCTVRLFAIDRAGNINATSISFSVDNSAPEASIDAPKKGWFNTDFTVEFTVRDDQGLRNRSYRINNSGWKPLNAPEIDVNISRYCRVQGSETCPVEVNATNKVNMTTTAVRKYSIDTSEPVFDSLTPGNNSNVSSGQSFTANYGDRVSGIKKARYYTANDAGSISSSFTPVWSQNDTRSLDLLIRDRAGNTITRNFSITVDDTDPVFHGFSPENNTNITPERNLTINVTDHYTAVVTGRYNRGSGNRTYTPNQSTEVAWSEGQQDVTVYASDAASPANWETTSLSYFVDGTPPTIILDEPRNDTVIRLDRNLTLNATDSGVGIQQTATFYNTDTQSVEQFPLNQSFDPGWTSEGPHWFRPRVNDTLNNSDVRGYRFTLDGTPPVIQTIELNRSFLDTGQIVRIESQVTDQYSRVADVQAKIINGAGTVVDTLPMPRFTEATYNDTFVPTSTTTQNYTVNLTVQDRLQHTDFNASTEFMLDTFTPNSSAYRFNISARQPSGEVRLYREQSIIFRTNLSDNVGISSAAIIVNTSSNPASGERLTLSRQQGTVWSVAYTDTGRTGYYNITAINVTDSVGNRNETRRTLARFHVVNHSITASLGGGQLIDAGSVEQLNITVDLNQNLTAPTISLFPPTNTSGSLLYTNTSAYTCSFGTGCTVRPHPDATRLLVTGTGTGTTLNISAPVRAAAPTIDTNTTWTSHILHGNQTATTAIVTPDLQVTASYCNGSTTCQVLQNQAFNFTVNITNRGGADHTGNATNVQVSYTVSGLDIADQKLLGDLPVNTSRNVTFEVNITEAGSQSIDIQAIDNLSKAYNASQIKTVDVTDVVEPTIRQISIENQKLSLNSDQQIDVRASDNVGITDVIATVEDPDGNMSNVSLTRIEGDRKDGRWRGAFSETETEGNYTVQTVYVNDSAGNANKQDIERRFAVFDLTASLELQYATLQTGRNITVLSNVSGNTTAVQSVQLNVSKPRGVQEFVDLSRTPRASEYSVTYTNISRSGNYTLKLEVEAGAAVTNRTFIDVPFGTPGIEVFAGNASEIIVPRPGTYNISWQVLPLNGDLRNVSTNLSIGNTAILNNTGASNRSLGNVTVEEGFQTATYSLETGSAGTVFVNISVNATGATANASFRFTVADSDTSRPVIEDFGERTPVINVNESATILANVTDNSLLQNVTIQVLHPRNGSGYNETPVAMEQIGRNQFSYVFTNTTEPGHYRYRITGWDVMANSRSVVSNSFNVTRDYQVDISTDHRIYRKTESPRFSISVQDVHGNRVENFLLNLSVDKAGIEETLLANARTDTYTMQLQGSDPPTSESSTARYTVYANVSKNGNTGSATASFNVSNTLQVIFITPDQDEAIDVRPGKEFRIRVVVTGPRGGLVSTGKFTASCNTCDNGSKITKGMTGKGSGQYVVNFTAPTSTGNTALQVSGFESFSSGSQFLTIQVGTPSNNTGGAGPGGGGFGGGGGQPRLTITKLSPVFELPAGTETANLSVRTNRNATCRYAGREIPNPSFETANAFSITGARIHTVILNVSSGTGYPITVFCRSANLNASAEVFFSVQEEEVTTFQLDVPNRIEPITQGTTGSGSFTIFNNGTRQLSVSIESDTSCCDTWIENNGVRTTNVTVPAGSETRLTLFVDVPLNTSLGVKTIDLSFSSAEIRREKTVNVEITKSPYIERLEELRRIADRLKKNITDYRQSGIQTEQLEQQYRKLQRRLKFARTAIRNDDRQVLKQQVDRAEEIAANIRGQLRAKAFKHFVLTNWWKWVLEFIAAYITFFLATMVFIPYYRLRSEYLNTQEQLDNAIEARKKAEKQYFKRQIDRDTFMNIMTEQQDEILELRSRRDELEEELETAIRDRLTVGNFLAAPVRAFREIARWWQSRRQMEEESEE